MISIIIIALIITAAILLNGFMNNGLIKKHVGNDLDFNPKKEKMGILRMYSIILAFAIPFFGAFYFPSWFRYPSAESYLFWSEGLLADNIDTFGINDSRYIGDEGYIYSNGDTVLSGFLYKENGYYRRGKFQYEKSEHIKKYGGVDVTVYNLKEISKNVIFISFLEVKEYEVTVNGIEGAKYNVSKYWTTYNYILDETVKNFSILIGGDETILTLK